MSFSLETILQLALLMLLAVFVPLRLARLLPWRLGAVLWNGLLSALVLWLAGMALMALPYFAGARGIFAGMAQDPLGAFLWLARLGALSAIAWLPLLAITVLGIASRIAQNPDRKGLAG